MRVLVNFPCAPSVVLAFEGATTIAALEVKQAVAARQAGVAAADLRLVDGARELADDGRVGCGGRPAVLECVARVVGGKGGFGAMLRAERGGVDAKKTTNFEAMRDLSGRRMRHVNNEKKLQEWIDAAPEREAEARREKEAAKERKRAEAEHSRTEAEAAKYASQVESVRETVGQGVAMGIVAAKKRQRAAAAAEAARLGLEAAASPAEDAPQPAKRQRADPAAAAPSAAAAPAAAAPAAAPAGAAASGGKPAPIDLSKYTSAGELLAQAGADSVKVELSRLGLKCGGTPQMRAERLFSTKGAQPHFVPPLRGC